MTHKAFFCQHWSDAFRAAAFQSRLHDPAMAQRWAQARFFEEFLPVRQRLACRALIEAAVEAMPDIPVPEGGWCSCVLSDATARLYPQHRRPATEPQEDFALCALLAIQLLLEEERRALPFDWHIDFAFCTDEEAAGSLFYPRFLQVWRQDFVYELLRLGSELTPFSTLQHIAMVHHVAMTAGRALRRSGAAVDLALTSAAAAGHDIGKFGCMPGERVSYLHYYYTDEWLTRSGLPQVGQVAGNHSTWDLELANLSVESMLLIYADFRSKQRREADGRETAALYALKDAFDVILSKLDNVDAAKKRRYEYVYRKLRDFEDYLIAHGVDVTLQGRNTEPSPQPDIALMKPDEYYRAFCLTAVEHNLDMMRRLSHEGLFSDLLEMARSEKDWTRVRTYLCVLEDYFTYLSTNQKIQTVYFLYELLLHPEGDIRRQAAALMGQVMAKFSLRYKKELPSSAPRAAVEQTQFALWSQYLNLLFYPDHKLTPQQTSHIRFTAKLVVSATLENCAPQETEQFLSVLLSHYQSPHVEDEGAALALTDTLCYLPLKLLTEERAEQVAAFALAQCRGHSPSLQAAALQFFFRASQTLPESHPLRSALERLRQEELTFALPSLRYRYARVCGVPAEQAMEALTNEEVSDILLDNLKTATPWMIKVVNVELLSRYAACGMGSAMQIAAHFANLIRVSEAVVVRQRAGRALLGIAPRLTSEERNEIAVELAKALESGHYEFSKYIPQYLGTFMLWLPPAELDEVIDYLAELLSHSADSVVASALDTVGFALESYRTYPQRFPEEEAVWDRRRRRLAGLLLKGMASYRQAVQQEAMYVLGDTLFASPRFPDERRAWLFTLCAHKLLFLMHENQEEGLNDLYCSAALYRMYQFIVRYETDNGPFRFTQRQKVAFFPGTFDPFTLSHKALACTIRDMGYEVFLAVDEFSWSKKTQPSLIRRRIASMSVADEFHVHLFPYNIPVNIATPGDLRRLKDMFAGRELYLIVGSDVIHGASSYKAAPSPDSVHSMNHIVFRRVSALHGEEKDMDADVGMITGKVVQLQLPSQLEDISSTRIRENIDMNRDISHLIDPMVQEYIYQRGLYLREPQYKPLLSPGTLRFDEAAPEAPLLAELQAIGMPPAAAQGVQRRGERIMTLRSGDELLAAASFDQRRTRELLALLGDPVRVNDVRNAASGRLLCITGLYGRDDESLQLLLTQLFAQAMEQDCLWALFAALDAPASPMADDLLRQQGLRLVRPGDPSLLLADMSAPVVFLQNVETAIKPPFSGDSAVLSAIRQARRRFKLGLVALYPGRLIFTISSQLVLHRLVEKITALNGVPMTPTQPRVLGPYMCVPFGKLLRRAAIPNTVTKTIHTDKVFAADRRTQWIQAFPGYAPLADQMRVVHSFRRPVILVDDQLHTGRRIGVLDPLAREQQVEIKEVLVGILSGQGRDLAQQLGRDVDYVYFVPNLRAWYVESTLYPFIGGDTVEHPAMERSGLQPSVNLILPYVYPEHLRQCGADAAYTFSRTCIENTLYIIEALETAYRRVYARSLTLRRLSEAVVLPLCPDKGRMSYNPDGAVSDYLRDDLETLRRLENLFR
mgnify:FL=1